MEMIEEYAREKVDAETEDESIMVEKSEGIDRARAESEAKEGDEYDMRNQGWRAKSLSLRNSKNR